MQILNLSPGGANQGVLQPCDLYTFFKEVHAMWVAMGEYSELSIHDVVDEIIDMVQPAQPSRGLTLAELAASRMAGTVFSILANVDQFFQYNYREQQLHEQ
jgi:serine/threonine-protein phosphatase 2A regulatory subunit B''